jgi:hypothetical protein
VPARDTNLFRSFGFAIRKHILRICRIPKELTLFSVYNDVFYNVRILRRLDSPLLEGNLEDVKVIPSATSFSLLAPLAERLLTMTDAEGNYR